MKKPTILVAVIAATAATAALAGTPLAASAVAGGERGVRTARAAVQELEGAGAPLELARALLAEGVLTAATGRAERARVRLGRALEVAQRCHAQPLAREITEQLVAAGGRPRRSAAVGVSGLSHTELSVASAAACGLSNRQISEQLFIGHGTVKNHLHSVYRKLDVSSRAQLAAALMNGIDRSRSR